MTIVAGGKMQGGHVSVISVPWEGTRCSVTDRLTACLAEFQTTGNRSCVSRFEVVFFKFVLMKIRIINAFVKSSPSTGRKQVPNRL